MWPDSPRWLVGTQQRFRGGDPPFLISSLFPAVGPEVFLPRPRHLMADRPPRGATCWPRWGDPDRWEGESKGDARAALQAYAREALGR